MGGLYGGVAKFSEIARRGLGTAFGAALLTRADMMAVPAVHLPRQTPEQTPATLAPALTAHLLYGAATELVKRAAL
jgi:hypothetical protein